MNWGTDLLNRKMKSIVRDFVLNELNKCAWNIEIAVRKFCATRDEILGILKQSKTEAMLAIV